MNLFHMSHKHASLYQRLELFSIKITLDKNIYTVGHKTTLLNLQYL